MADVDVATVDEAALTAVKDATEAANAIAAGSMDEDDDDEDPENEEDIEKQVLGQDNGRKIFLGKFLKGVEIYLMIT